MRIILLAVAMAVSLPGASWVHRARKSAVAGACIAEAGDVLSSYRDSRIPGLYETNGFYAPDGRFSLGRIVAVKAALCGGLLLADKLAGHSRNADAGIISGSVALGVPAGVASVHNIRLK